MTVGKATVMTAPSSDIRPEQSQNGFAGAWIPAVGETFKEFIMDNIIVYLDDAEFALHQLMPMKQPVNGSQTPTHWPAIQEVLVGIQMRVLVWAILLATAI